MQARLPTNQFCTNSRNACTGPQDGLYPEWMGKWMWRDLLMESSEISGSASVCSPAELLPLTLVASSEDKAAAWCICALSMSEKRQRRLPWPMGWLFWREPPS